MEGAGRGRATAARRSVDKYSKRGFFGEPLSPRARVSWPLRARHAAQRQALMQGPKRPGPVVGF